jgi:hypothetical protein
MTLGVSVTDSLTSAVVSNTKAVTLTTTWARYQVNVYVPREYVNATLVASISGTGNSKVIGLDAAQVEDGFKATDYFDGTYIINGASWSGTSNASKSILFENKGLKQPRLESDIPKFLAMGTPYSIEFSATDVFSGYA